MNVDDLKSWLVEEAETADEKAEDDEWWEGYAAAIQSVIEQLNA